MTKCRRFALSAVFAFLIPIAASAATAEIRVLFDVDNQLATGCTVGGMSGVDQVLVTQVTDSETSASVTQTHRLVCTSGVLGGPVDIITTGWPAGWSPSSGNMLVETRLPYTAFDSSSRPGMMRLGLDGTRGTGSFSVLTTPKGDPILFPVPSRRRRAVGFPGGQRMIVMDGLGNDWGMISALTSGTAGGGASSIKLIKAFGFSNPIDSFVYFNFNLNLSGTGILAVDDTYTRTQGQSLAVAAPGVLGNDQPNTLPLTATKVSEPNDGAVTLNPDGSFTFTPYHPNSLTTDSFKYKATSGSDESNVATVRIKVFSINQAPAITSASSTTFTVATPGSFTVTVTGFPTPTVVQSGTLPVGVTFNSSTRVLSGTPGLNSAGTYPITFTATNGVGSPAVQNFTLFVVCPTITVTPATLPNGTVSQAYNQSFSASGGTAPYVFTLDSGTLPPGLTLVSNVLSGIPTAPGAYPFSIRATDAMGCSVVVPYTLTINCQTITVTNPGVSSGVAAAPFSQTFTQSGASGTATFTTASTLPAGLALSTAGVLSGTPTQTGTFPIVVTATDANGCTGTGPTYTLTITCQTILVTNPANANGTAGSAFNETFTQTGAIGTTTFTLASGTLPAGLTLATNGVLSGTPTQTGSFPISVTATDSNGCTGTGGTYTIVIGCQTITVNNPANANGTVSAAFSEVFTQSSAIGSVTFTTASTLPAGLTLAPNGTLSGTPTQTGTFPIVVTVTDANGCTGTGATYNLVVGCQTITVNNPVNTSGTVSSPFSETFTQSGAVGSTTFTTASTLPAGLTLATNGVLSGTPTQTGSFPIVVTVTDANGCTGTSATYNLVIGCQTITVTNPANATGPAGSPFSETFTQTGGIGSATFTTASTLPTGLTLAANGVLSGTPTQGGTFPIVVTVTDANGCTGTGATYNLIITCPVITVTNPANGNGTANAAFSETFTQSGGTGAPTFTLASGTLPAGLSLATNGVLSGTPTQTGTFPITVTATDVNGCTGTGPTYTIVIACQVITVNNPANANGTASSAFSETFTHTGGIGTTTFTLASGTLPAGLTLASNGVLSGTPTQTGSFPITVTATDANGCTGTGATYTIVIGCQVINVTNPATTAGAVSAPFSETFTQTGAIGTATFTTASTLPAGLTLSTAGVLSGTPTEDGTFPIVVTVTDSNGCTGTGSTYNLFIGCQTITVTNPVNTSGTVSAPFSETFTQTSAIGTATFTTASTLPAGLTLSTAGVLSGTPTQAGSFPIVVTVTDSNGCTGTGATYNLTIGCQVITVTNPANATGPAGSPFSETFTQTGAIGTATFTTASTLPTGLTLSAAGVLSGTPTQGGTFPIVVTVTDSNGCTGTGATYNLVITCPVITVSNPANANGTAGSAFSETFTQVGGQGTITFTLASGTLPAGLTLATNGVLSGTPTQTGSFPITVTATDQNGCTGTGPTYTLVIGCQTITVNNPANASGTASSAFSETFTQTGGIGTTTFTLASGTLPAGLTLAANGVLSGTPTQTGSFPITVTATDSNGCTGTGATYTIVIGCQTITVNNPANVNGTINVAFSETFTQTGAIGSATFTTASTLPSGLTLSAAGVLSGTPGQVGSFPIVVTVTDANGCTGTGATYNLVIGCQTITVTNPANANGTVGTVFSETFTQTGANGTATFTTASTLPAGITLSTAGVLSGTPTQAGNFPIVVTVTDSNGCTGTSATYNLVIVCQVITVTNPGVTTGTVDAVFSQAFTQTGAVGTATFTTASTLPSGLSLSTAGVLSGTPGQPGTFPIVVTVTDSNGCTGTSATYNLVIACQTITVTNPATTTGTVDAAFSQTFTQTGVGTHTPATFTTSSTLPSGLTLSTGGVLSGTPGQPGTFPIVVTVTDVNGCTGTSATYNLVIACQTITVTNPGVTAATYNTAFSQTFTQTGVGTHTPATFTTASTLPTGMSLSTAGVLSGTPTQTGTFPIVVTVTDVNGCSGTGSTYTLAVAPVADNDTINGGVDNTQLVLTGGTTTTPSTPSVQVADTIKNGDLPSAATVSVVPGTFATTAGGSVTVAADGTFLYTPPVNSAAAAITTDSFTYTVTSNTGGTGPVTSAPATVTINLLGRVWYVKNDSAAGGNGQSQTPFDTLVEAQTASTANDHIFVYFGNGTNSGQNAGITLKAGQKLYGQGVTLLVNGSTLVTAGSQALIGNSGGVGVTATNITGVEIKGLSLSASTDAVFVSTTGASNGGVEVAQNTVTSAGAQGFNVDGSSTGTLTMSIHDNTLTTTGNAIDVNRTAGTLIINAFDDNVVSGNTGGSGIVVSGALFDSNLAAGYQAVSGGVTTIGAIGNGVGTSGMTLTNVTGDLTFTDLDIVADGGAAFTLTGTGAANIGAGTGTQVTVGAGVADFRSTGGPAVDVNNATVDLRLANLQTTNASTRGVSLVNVSDSTTTAARFSATGGSITTTAGATGPVFNVSGGNVGISFPGTITNSGTGRAILVDSLAMDDASDDVSFSGAITENGAGILLNNNSGAGRAISFSGGLTINTATGEGFGATSNTNSLGLNITGTNTISSTSATALRVTNTTIGSSNITFRKISSGNSTAAADPASGIIINTTGTLGRLIVTGNAGTCSSLADCTGAAIQNTTSHGISLNSTLNPSFTRVAIQNTAGSGIDGTAVNGFTLDTSFLDNNGTGGGADESNVAFDVQTAGTETNVSGLVTITNNTLTNARFHGVRILNFSGTISDLVITGNTITSSTSVATSLGSGIHIQALGSTTTVSNITKGNISNNTITNFPSDAGIEVKGGNSTASGAGGTMGTPGSGVNIISITSNLIAGASAANKMGTMFIDIGVSGGNSGSRSQANFDISNNGTVANPLANCAGIGIGVGNTGYATSTITTNGNRLAPNNTVASAGIGGGNGLVSSSAETPDLTWTINNNNISLVDGNGILAVARGASGIMKVKIQNNTVAAPLTGVRPGIRIDAGNAASVDDAVCLNISGNTSAGSGGSQGIGLRKQGTVSNVNDFGINGMVATATPGVEAYVNGLNPAGGGTLLISATSGFSNCSFP